MRDNLGEGFVSLTLTLIMSGILGSSRCVLKVVELHEVRLRIFMGRTNGGS